MTEKGKKRSIIVTGTGPQNTTKRGDDIPLKKADTRIVPAQSPAPMSIEEMSEYISSITSDQRDGNAYTVSGEANVTSIRNEDGTPAPLSTSNNDIFASLEFLSSLGILGQTFTSEDIAAITDPEKGLHDMLRDIIGNPGGRSINEDGTAVNHGDGFATKKTPSEAGSIQRKLSAVLKKNRFNPSGETPFVQAGSISSSTKSIDTRSIGKSQARLGSYDNGAGNVSYEQMKKIGLALMLRSTGEFIGRDGDPTDIGISTAAIIPGEAQLAVTKLDQKSLWASDLTEAQGAPPGGAGLESDLVFDEAGSVIGGSYGNLNTFLEPFGGFAPVGMIILGAALVIAAKLAVEGFLSLINLVFSPDPINDKSIPNAERDIRPMGASSARANARGGLVDRSSFGIATTKYDYLTAVNRGIDVFFEFDGTSFVKVIKSPGYYAVLVRSIIRSTSRIISGLVDAVSGSTTPLSGVQALLGMVDVISSSKIIAFLNVLAGLGDGIIELENQGFLTPDAIGQLGNPTNLPDSGKISTIDRLTDNTATHIMKSRAKDGATQLAWRTSSTLSSYLLPASVIKASSLLSSPTVNATSALASLSSAKIEVATKRISSENAKKIEDKLEAEYVPFYFHDLRTNEITSFHAFLSSVSDNYDAAYNDGQFAGRVDPIMVYKSTKRAIDLSFWVVSTNEEDFDIMWWKINKLVTLLYPQWSKGKKLEAGSDTFIQPFSQVMTSSPMIRLRLGDLFRSNYSKFALARLFGLGTSDFSLDGSESVIEESQEEEFAANLQKIGDAIKRQIANPSSVQDPESAGYFIGDKAILKPVKGVLKLKIAGEQALRDTTNPLNVNITGRTLTSHPHSNKQITTYEFTLEQPAEGVSSGPYLIDHSSLEPNIPYLNAQIADAESANSAQPTPESQAVEDFFTAKNNSIVRSFESVAGRGLAGVIKSMRVDWKTPRWETTLGRRAPQWAQITMAFHPIHDITPGLDDAGFNRAPIYPVGKIAKPVAGDPFDDDASDSEYSKAHLEVNKSNKKRGF